MDRDDDIEATIRTTSSRLPAGAAFVDQVEHGSRALELGRVVGRGGMATVCEAQQPVLRRSVAVKHTVEDSPDEDRDALVQEAWLTGLLEHPNIVPLHDLQVIDGEPHVVMKLIDGVPWERLVQRPVVVETRFQSDPLDWHLQTLMTVCRAVEYAHSRGILHLDLKPANVMIGDYGEVWLVDWGIAVALDDDRPELPGPVVPDEAFGTPAYMAPEMAIAGARLSPATDVFLLGAVLYKILTGEPVRTGRSATELLARMQDPVAIPPDVPMRELLEQSLTVDPAQRIQDVATFRDGVQAFRRRRGAIELSERASLQLVELVRGIGDEAPRGELYNLFGACRFGFEEALRSWPTAELALAGRREAIEVMARYELDAGDDRAAELLIELLEAPPADLVAHFEQVRDERARARDDLARIRVANDPRTAWGARLMVALLMSAVYVATPIGTALIGLPQGYLREMGIAGVTFTLTMTLLVVLRRRIASSRISVALLSGAVLGPALVTLMHVGCWLAGMDSQLAGTLELFIYFALATVATLLAEYRMLPSAIGYLVAYYLAMAMEGTTLLWMNLANLVLFLNVGLVWIPAGFRNEMPEDVPLL